MLSTIDASLCSFSSCCAWYPWCDAVANTLTIVRACSNARIRLAGRFECDSSSCWIKVVELSTRSCLSTGPSCGLNVESKMLDGVEAPVPISGPCALPCCRLLALTPLCEGLLDWKFSQASVEFQFLATYDGGTPRRGRRPLNRSRVHETPIEAQLRHSACLSHFVCGVWRYEKEKFT
jgi:hypothetical protein